MACPIQEIALRRVYLFQLPVAITNIVRRDKIAFAVGREDVDQFTAFINAVFRTGEGCVTLRSACGFGVGFGYLYPEFF